MDENVESWILDENNSQVEVEQKQRYPSNRTTFDYLKSNILSIKQNSDIQNLSSSPGCLCSYHTVERKCSVKKTAMRHLCRSCTKVYEVLSLCNYFTILYKMRITIDTNMHVDNKFLVIVYWLKNQPYQLIWEIKSISSGKIILNLAHITTFFKWKV